MGQRFAVHGRVIDKLVCVFVHAGVYVDVVGVQREHVGQRFTNPNGESGLACLGTEISGYGGGIGPSVEV